MSKYEGETRLYELENGAVYKMPSVHCVFCKHCTDLFYDYTNGPYMFTCDKDLELNISETICSCEGFEDDGYVFDEEEHKKRMASIEVASKLLDKWFEELRNSIENDDKYKDKSIIWKKEIWKTEGEK